MNKLGIGKKRIKRTYEQKQKADKLTEYKKRKEELFNKLKLEENQKKSKELLNKYKKVVKMRSDFLNKLENVEKEKKELICKISDITGKILMTTDKEEEADLLKKKNSYKLELEQLNDINKLNIYPTIKNQLKELSESKLSDDSLKETEKLNKVINKELEKLRKEAKEMAIIYKNLEVDLLDIQDNLYSNRVRELYRDLKIPGKAKLESNNDIKYVVNYADKNYYPKD